MLKRASVLLSVLLWAGGASATSTVSPTAGGNPLLVGENQAVSLTLELLTTDLVGSINVEIFGFGLTITCANATSVGAPSYNCSDIAGGIQVNASDFASGLASGLDFVQLDFTTPVASAGASLALGSLTPNPGSTNYRNCPTTLANCLFPSPLGDGVDAAFTNDSQDIVQVVPEPGTAALLSLGLLGLAIRRR